MTETLDFYLQFGGWIGNVCFVIGAYILTLRKPKTYAAFNIVGNSAYIVQGYFYTNWSLFVLSIILASLSALLLLKWRQ